MKNWKEELLTALEEQAVDLKEVRIYDVAKAHGYNHIPNHDVLDIVNAFRSVTRNTARLSCWTMRDRTHPSSRTVS